jgi:hypothetical protein
MHFDGVAVDALPGGQKKAQGGWGWAEERGAVVDGVGEP